MSATITTLGKPRPAERSRLKEIWRNLRRSSSGMIGLTILVAHLVIALISPAIVPYEPTQIDASSLMQSPSMEHLFGTDSFGRDVFSRVLMGGRIALVITIIAGVLAITWGGLLGIVIGFLGGVVDEVVMRFVDALLSFPSIFIYLLVISVLGSSNLILILVLSITNGISIIRIARGATLGFVARDFITAARARGERTATVVLRELLPNVFDVLLVEFAMRWSWMLLYFSSLSFLGFGVTPPTPDWGLMILTVGYRSRQGQMVDILRNVSLEMSQGEILGLVGESGCGKSTLGLALLGFLRPGGQLRTGTVCFDGVDLFGLTLEELEQFRGKRVALIPQSTGQSLTPTMRVGAQIAEVLTLHLGYGQAAARDRVVELLSQVKLPQVNCSGLAFR
jgi:peptide/nickel transport system permease protein